jgi:dephospho-CoA kinase
MLRVGLTGGLACGKSFVARTLESFGCTVVRADELGHEVLLPGGPADGPVLEEFGPGILAEDGAVDRKKLAALVFDNPERLAKLNSLIHPAVIRREEELFAQAQQRDPNAIAVLEAAILIENGSYKRFDKLIVVVCAPEQQVARAMHRDGCSEEEAHARLRRQMPVEEKRKYADFVIDTSGTKENTVEQTRSLYERLRSLAK